jgi:hypothetical protein
MVGVIYLLIAAAWFAVGGFKQRREPPDTARN